MSYTTPAEAIAYFAALYGYDQWPTEEATQQQALNSAQQQLDSLCQWYGYPTDPDQVNAFPREGETEAPQGVKDAECEIAYSIITTGSTSTDAGDPLTELTAGSVSIKFDAGASSNPLVNDLTTKLLSPYGLCAGSGSTQITPMMRS